MDVVTLQLANNYTSDTASQFGAIKGSPCTVGGYCYDEQGNTILELIWTNNVGDRRITLVTIQKGEQGIQGEKGDKGDSGIYPKSFYQNNGHLIVVMSDNTEQDCGMIPQSKVEISQESGNVLEQKEDGLYTPSTPIEISRKDGNSIQHEDDGIYVPPITDENIDIDFSNYFN